MKNKIYIFLFFVLASVFNVNRVNAQPFFAGGSVQFGSVCENSTPSDITSFLSVSDGSTTDTLFWASFYGPSNGTLVAADTVMTNGGVVTPTGLTYMPNTGYSGPDSFTVMVTDGMEADTIYTTIYVTVNPLPVVADIAGTNSVCSGSATTLTDDTASGVWSSADPTIATIGSSTGIVTGVATSLETTVISYAVTNGCGTTSVSATVTVNPVPDAISGALNVCVNNTDSLWDDTASGTWATSDATLARISATGVVTGVATGMPVISYTLHTGCMVTTSVMVNPLPAQYIVMGGGQYCYGSAIPFDISLSYSDVGFTYYLYQGTTQVGTPLSGDATPIDFGYYSAPGAYTVLSVNNSTSCSLVMTDTAFIISNPLPLIDTVSGGGSYCSGGTGEMVGVNSSSRGVNYQVYHHSVADGGYMAGTGAAMNIALFTDSGSYTVIATDTTTIDFCQNTMYGSAHIGVNPLPAIYTVTGGGSYCAHDTGLHIGLSGSNTGIMYVLLKGITPVDTVNGTGSAIDFGLYTVEGSYSVEAINSSTLCTSNMTGSVPVFINPLPAVYNLTGGGSYCYGGNGKDIMLNASNTGIVYELMDNGSPVGINLSGTDSSIDFGNQSDSGTYTVVAVDPATSCIATMSGMPAITINELPAVYTLTGSGSYCAGGSGLLVGLDFSDTAISYQLYYNGAPTGTALRGTNTTLYFGLDTASGHYIAIATNPVTICTDTMASIVTITVNAAPLAHNVTGGGSFCDHGAGVAIGLNGSNPGVSYQLYYGTFPVGPTVNGTGSALSFGMDTLGGTYTVLATDTTHYCSAIMNDSAIVVVNPLLSPTVRLTPRDTTICAGSMITFAAAASNGGAPTHYAWKVNGTATGTDSSQFSFVPTNGNLITMKITDSAGCFNYDTATDTVNITVLPNGTPTVTIAANDLVVCKGTPVTFTTTDSLAGAGPTFTWVVNGTPSGFGSSFTYIPRNGDIVYTGMVSNYLCRLSTLVVSNNIMVTVDSPIVPSLEINANPGTYISKGQADTLTAVVTNGGSAPMYQWYIGSAPVLGATNSVYVNPGFAAPRDSVSCQVTRNDACKLAGFNGVIVNVSTLGVASVVNNIALALYPNPNKGEFTLEGNGLTTSEPVSIIITDMLGQTVYTGSATPLNGTFKELIELGSGAASGMYLISLHSPEGNNMMHFVLEK